MPLDNKYDFIMYITVKDANPNGDPLNRNRPRVDFDGFGEITDICLKRKLRNRMMDLDERVFVQSNERKIDDCKNLQERFERVPSLKNEKNPDNITKIASSIWTDVRSFGQVFSFSKNGISVGIRGPVSIHTGISEEIVKIAPMDIKRVPKEILNNKSNVKKTSNLIKNISVVEFGTYKIVGSINPQLSEITGFNERDVEMLKNLLLTIFRNDSSLSRPEGSMEVSKLYWFKHKSKIGDYPASKLHNCIRLEIQDPEKKDFSRYKIVENIPDTFKRNERQNLVELSYK